MEPKSFIGDIVRIECGDKGIYKGRVTQIDTKLQQITLQDVYLNDTELSVLSINIRAEDIKDLIILTHHLEVKNSSRPEKEMDRTEKDSTKSRNPKPSSKLEMSPVSKKNQSKGEKSVRKQRRDVIVGDENVYSKPDFDFEKNLALFDKKAIFQELMDSMLQGETKSVVRNYKGNENILETEPVSLRRIMVPLEHAGKEYTTDNGFIVPAISSDLRKALFAQAEKAGLSVVQRTENVGICACQMALQLVGGERRICPKNSHQAPEIVVLAGPHLGGLQAIATARHLANHTAKVKLFVPEHSRLLDSQLELFGKTNGSVLTAVRELPQQPVDLVIDALTNHDNHETQHHWLPWVIEWANHNKAPVLALDPCIRTTKAVNVVIKWSITLALPLIGSSKSGRLYLADVGIPSGVFKEVGITYTSPFGDKFLIPLYDW